jgi:hypothetical protein
MYQQTHMKLNLTASYSPDIDAENYARAFFDNYILSHGRGDMTEYLKKLIKNENILTILNNSKDGNSAKTSLTDLLTNNDENNSLQEKALKLESEWLKLGDQIILTLENLFQAPCPFSKIHIDLTTLPFCPYDYKNKHIFVYANTDIQSQMRIILHELNHFFFYSMYPNLPLKNNRPELYELLKESLTLFSNPEQAGKPNEQKLRDYYIQNNIRSIKQAVEMGSKYLERI